MNPTEEQSAIVSLADDPANLQIIAFAGCVAAGSMIRIRRGNGPTVKNRMIEKLLYIKNPETPVLVQCDVDGFSQYVPMLGCQFSGVKSTLRLETTLGEVIATPDHEIKTSNGWKALCDVCLGDGILARTTAFPGRKEGRVIIYSVRHHPHAHQHNVQEYGNYGRVPRAKLVVEAEMNRLSLEEMILIVRHDPYKAATLTYLAPEYDIHHKDEDPANDDIRNLEVLTKVEHRLRHKMHLNHTRLGLTKVIQLSSAGRRLTYDIMMPGPHHNFLVNGHVVHNCGKTSTLEMFDRTAIPGPRLCLAFNKRIAEEVAKRLAPTTECRTFNSLGHRIWSAAIAPKLVLEPKKTQGLFKETVTKLRKPDRDAAWEEYGEVCTAVNLAKGRGYIPQGANCWSRRLIGEEFFDGLEDPLSKNGKDMVNEILDASIGASYRGLIDFNDQLYMPTLFGGSFPRFPCVMVDEAQDLSPINHEMLRKLCKSSRLVAVGDPFQSIYQFRGAMQDGMAIQRAAFQMHTKALSISFRCPSAIVANARWRAPGFRALNHGGTVSSLKELACDGIADASAIICRNNAPLFALACRLLAAGRSCRVAGSDVGPKLINLLRRLGDENLPRSAVLACIDTWESRKGDSGSASDLAACMRIFANLGDTLRDAISYAEHVLRQDGRVLLTTGHKAKGLEWDTVYFLDPWLIGKSEQELNLKYVVETRAKENLFYVDSRDIA